MKRPTRLLKWFAASVVLFQATSCSQNLVASNVVAGLRDGLVTTTTGIVETLINGVFDSASAGAPGAGLFIGI